MIRCSKFKFKDYNGEIHNELISSMSVYNGIDFSKVLYCGKPIQFISIKGCKNILPTVKITKGYFDQLILGEVYNSKCIIGDLDNTKISLNVTIGEEEHDIVISSVFFRLLSDKLKEEKTGLPVVINSINGYVNAMENAAIYGDTLYFFDENYLGKYIVKLTNREYCEIVLRDCDYNQVSKVLNEGNTVNFGIDGLDVVSITYQEQTLYNKSTHRFINNCLVGLESDKQDEFFCNKKLDISLLNDDTVSLFSVKDYDGRNYEEFVEGECELEGEPVTEIDFVAYTSSYPELEYDGDSFQYINIDTL